MSEMVEPLGSAGECIEKMLVKDGPATPDAPAAPEEPGSPVGPVGPVGPKTPDVPVAPVGPAPSDDYNWLGRVLSDTIENHHVTGFLCDPLRPSR